MDLDGAALEEVEGEADGEEGGLEWCDGPTAGAGGVCGADDAGREGGREGGREEFIRLYDCLGPVLVHLVWV